MAIYKGFEIQIVDGPGINANVIASLGNIAIPFLESNGYTTPSGQKTNPPTDFLSAYTDEYLNAGGLGFGYGDALYNTVLTYLPLAKNLILNEYAGYYVRLFNGSGKYAVSAQVLPKASGTVVGGFTPHNADGSQVTGNTGAFLTFFAGMSANWRVPVVNLNNGSIVSYVGSLDVSGNIAQPNTVRMEFAVYGMTADVIEWVNGLDQYVPPPTDPYTQGGESDTGGGTGNFDGTSVDVDFASLPTLSAVDTGFITLYNPNLAQLRALANYMWSGLFDIDTFKKLFADPMQAILGLSIVPGPVPGGAAQNVKIGNIDTGVAMTKATTQYINIDCGTLNVEEFWGAYLDYEPYTKAEIYLPFIGVHQIAVDDIMNKPVHIMYHIDLLSGGCACEIKCGGSVLYTFIGSCAVSIPVTGSDWTNLINGVLSAASAIGTMVATGGATAPAAAGEIASAAVNSLKPSIEKSGSVAGAGGLLAGKVPVLILTRPRQALPGKQNTFTGYPAFITRSLGAISGYTEVHSIRLSGIDGTESEIDEIEELLKGGVIL